MYRFLRMKSGLQNAPSTVQRTMDVALSAAKLQFALVYFGDFVVFPRAIAEHIDYFKHVLTLLRDAGYTA